MLPIKTTAEDIQALGDYLKSQVGWTPIDKMKKALPSQHSDNRKIEAMRHIGLLERDGANVKLSEAGRNYAQGDEPRRASILRTQLKADTLYGATMEWMHFGGKEAVSKTDLANYWHDNHQGDLQGAVGAALTDGVIFFMRLADAADLGSFVSAGKGRETHFKIDRAKLGEVVTGTVSAPPSLVPQASSPPAQTTQPVGPSHAQIAPGLNVTVEIHIAADAKPSTVEEIFKNMRKYLIPGGEGADEAK